jgi:hypothetical protein
MKIRDISISTEEIIPPLADFHWQATVRRIFVEDNTERYEVAPPPDVAMGATKEEAEDNLKLQVYNWLQSKTEIKRI